MADFSTLIASIEATIKQNGVQAITGQVLQDEMLLMVSAINQLKQDTLEGYSFGGGALASGASVSVTQNTFWLAGPGTYTINGESVTITAKGVSVIVYDSVGDDITTATLFAYDATPTAGSDNAPTSGGVAAALADKADREGSAPDLLAGFTANLVDTRSNGTPQSFIFRKSGGDGVNYLRRIKGATIVTDGVLKNNAATALVTRGRNAWDETGVVGALNSAGAVDTSFTTRFTTSFIPCLPNTDYCISSANADAGYGHYAFYDADQNLLQYVSSGILTNTPFTSPAGAAFLRVTFGSNYGATYRYDVAINISDSLNGTYEPYWTRTLPLNLSGVTGIPEGGTEADRVTIFPDGLAGVGTAQDVFYEEGGETKARVVMAKVNLGSFTDWFNTSVDGAASPANGRMRSYGVQDIIKRVAANSDVANIICPLFTKDSANATYAHSADHIISVGTLGDLYIYDSNYASDTGAQFATAMVGVYAIFELATPVVYTNLKNADNTPFTMPKMIEVDEDGTEEATYPADTTPFAPFECDSNYSVSIANLVRKLAE